MRERWVLLDVYDDDDVYYYIRWRLKLEGETENMGVCAKERKGVTVAVLMATPCTNSLGGESGGHKQEGCGGRKLCWKFQDEVHAHETASAKGGGAPMDAWMRRCQRVPGDVSGAAGLVDVNLRKCI